MARKTSRVYVTGLDKGLDTNIASSMIDEKSAVDLLNVRWNEGKVITKRGGYQVWCDQLTDPRGFGRLTLSAKREKLLIDGQKLFVTEDGADLTEITDKTFNSDAYDYTICQIKNKAYIWNRVDGGTVYNGTTLARPGTMPKAGFSVYYKGYHIASGTPGQESRIYMSTISNTDDFTNDPSATTDGPDPDNANDVPGATVFTGSPPDVAQFVDISPSDGEPITLLAEYQDYLIIGKTTSLWSMTIDITSNKPVIQLITRAVGCVGFKTAAAVDNDLIFLSDEGPMSLGNERDYAGALRTNLLAMKIKTFIDNINPEGWSKACAVYFDKMYLLSVPYGNSTTNSRTMMLDTRWNGWAIWDNVIATNWLNFMEEDNRRSLYFIRPNDNRVYLYKPGHFWDDGAPIDGYWRSKAIDAGMLDVTKRWSYFTLFMRNIGHTATVQISTELEELEPAEIFEGAVGEGLGFEPVGTGTWFGPVVADNSVIENTVQSTDDAWRTHAMVESRTISFEVRNNKGGETFFLSGYAAEYTSLGAYYFDQSRTF